MERMSTLDAGFFFVEHENVPMHLGSLALFEGPAPAYGDLVRLANSKTNSKAKTKGGPDGDRQAR